MNQATIILEFIKAVEESDDLDYIELVLLSVTEHTFDKISYHR